MKEPTKRQREVLDFIALYIQRNGFSPAIRDVADNFSISVKGANDHILALRKKGLVDQSDKKSRAIKLVKNSSEEEVINIPILGTVAAGRPIMSEENMSGSIKLNKSFFKRDAGYFALKVRGDSMEAAGIMEGDVAIILQQNVARNGEIVVVMVDDDMDEGYTLKRFFHEGSRIRLQPENPKYPVKYYTSEVQILGKLVHILRSYEKTSAFY